MVQETHATLSTNQIIRKLKPIITWAFVFSRTSDNLLVFNKLKFSLLVVTPHLRLGWFPDTVEKFTRERLFLAQFDANEVVFPMIKSKSNTTVIMCVNPPTILDLVRMLTN